MENQILFWIMTPQQHQAYCNYFGISESDSPFTYYEKDGMWYLAAEGNDDIMFDLLAFDESDGTYDNNFSTFWWDASTVPSELLP